MGFTVHGYADVVPPPPLDARALADAVLGPVAMVEPVQGFAGNQTFRLHTSRGVYYLKSGTTVEAEARACALARSVGVPAPEVLVVEPSYLICAEVPGGPSEASAVFEAAGRGFRRLHSLRGEGNWVAQLQQTIERLDVLADVVPDDLARRVREVVPPFIDTVAEVEPVLLHADLHPRHLYAVGNELTGVIDWGDAMYGDPLFDVARFTMSGEAATEAFLAGYDLRRTPDLDRTLSSYRVVWSLMALHAEHEAGGDWFAAHIETMTRELAA
ncbi:aminoglycoside phosphotransferase family protein [Kribbella sp. NPDC050820]|uniref:phosphotransferase family protein n=1 Tax=Kribbella sp. NPDC050820 TaxID=3155408 RepID=UPI00340A0B78